MKSEGLKAERWVKNIVKGILVPASGAIHASLDIRVIKPWGREFLLEVKMTSKDKFHLTPSLWQKVKARAEIRAMAPSLCVVFKTRFGRKGIIVLRKEDIPADFSYDNEYEEKGKSICITPLTNEVILTKWKGEELVIMPLYRLGDL